MNRPDSNERRSSTESAAKDLGDALNRLLSLDPDVDLSADDRRDLRRALRAQLQRAPAEQHLDALLELDSDVALPAGLAQRVGQAVRRRAGDEAHAKSASYGLWWVGVPLASLAAAAAVLFVLPLLGEDDTRGWSRDGASDLTAVHPVDVDDSPSDEFLAALPTLEDLEFLTDELDPLESDALFVFDAEDDLLFDLLEDV